MAEGEAQSDIDTTAADPSGVHDAVAAALRAGFAHPSTDNPPDADTWNGRVRVGAWLRGVDLGNVEAGPEQAQDAASALAARLDDEQRADATLALEIETVDTLEEVTPEGLNDLIASTELGLHGLVLTDTKTGKSASGWPAVAQREHSGVAQWVKSLLKQARPPGARLPGSVRVQRFTTTHLRLRIHDDGASPEALRGGLHLVQQADVSRSGLAAAATQAAAWLVRHQLANGHYRYEYQPPPPAPGGAATPTAPGGERATAGTWAKSDSIVRQAGCAWSIASLGTAFRGQEGEGPQALAKRFTASALLAISGFSKTSLRRDGPGGLYYLASPDGEARLGATPLLLLALTDLRLPKYEPELQQRLTATCLALQQAGGAFATSVRGFEMEGSERYFAGQIALALARRYFVDKRPRTDEAVQRAMTHYRQRWNDESDAPASDDDTIHDLSFVAWMLQACESHVSHTPNRDSKANAQAFAFEMADYALTQQHDTDHPNPLWVGGYQGSPGIGTAAYTEGMLRAYVIATLVEDQERIDRYGRSVATALRFLLQLQIAPPDLASIGADEHLGAVRGSLRRRNLRCDNAQHFLTAMLRASVLFQDKELQLAQ